MADVHVTTYAELRNAVNNATEATNIYIDNDINVDDEYPEGVSAIALSSSATFSVNIYGQNHKISNILMDSNIAVFSGRYASSTYYWLNIFDVNFENVQIEASGSTGKFLGDAASLKRCSVAITLSANSNAATENQFATSRVSISRCSLTISGANSIQNPTLTIGGDYYCDFNNIILLGRFRKVVLNGVRNSYIHGDFKQTYANSNYFTLKLIACEVNATIDMAVLPTCTGCSLAVINTDNLTLPSGKTLDNLSSLLTQCTTAEMESASTLWNDYGFPIR